MELIRVLLVEDDRDIAELIKASLEPRYECVVGSNGMEGLQLAFEGEPDLIISDIMMPVLDGHEFIRRLRKDAAFRNIPVIFLSALGSREHIKKGYDLGATLYLTKPIDPSRLRRNLELFIADHAVKARPKKRGVADVQRIIAAAGLATEKPASKPAPPENKSAKSKRAGADLPQSTAARAQGEKSKPKPRASSPVKAPGPASETPADAAPKVKDRVVKVDRAAGTLQRRIQAENNRIRILVVEDDPDASELIKIGLQDKYEILTAFDGLEAIERAVRYKPDIFIIDGMLPKMTGYQLVNMLKKNRLLRECPIVFISGKASARDKLYVEKLGVQHFLPKPFQVSQLSNLIEGLIKEPDFHIRGDRPSFQQITFETLQDYESHRNEPSRSVRAAKAMNENVHPKGTP